MDEAKKAAITRVANQKKIAKSAILVSDAAVCINDNGNILIYEIVTDKGVTVLLSGNRKCKPILGVHGNEEGLLLNKYDSLPCGMKYFFDYYKDQVNNSFFDTTTEIRHINEWQSLINGDSLPVSRTGYVEPLLKSLWSQQSSYNNAGDDAYNYLMPPGNNCEHCVAGCVAVAMGQVMYYWKYPVLINNIEKQFDWCNMVDILYSGSLYAKERDAISYLLLECGKSVNMDYGCSGSNAATEDARDALVDLFNYKNIADYKSRLWHSDDDWKNMLRSNIGRNKPVIYRGRSALIGGSGHAFVCDGFNQYDEFHINWGWGRGFSGSESYYTLDNIHIGDTIFKYYQGAIFDIEPKDNQDICDIALCLDTFYSVHTSHSHPIYESTPKTMSLLMSAPFTSPYSYRTIPAGATAEYVAHKEIILQPGFTAEYGSDFTARIEPCEACEERMVQMEILTGEDNYNTIDTTGYATCMFKSGDTVILMQPSDLQLYPNPTDNTLTIKSPDRIENVRILDNMGRPVFRWFVESNADELLTLNVQNIPEGVYILQLSTSDKRTHFGRFIKK